VEVSAWLTKGLEDSPLTEDAVDYLKGRGATDRIIEEWGIKVWDPPLTPCPDERLHRHYGTHFDRFEGKAIYPLLSPKGRFLGFDSRHIDRKDDVRYLLPESRWNPVWVNMPGAMDRIWSGSDIMVVEGRYDVLAMIQLAEARGSKIAILGSGPAHLSYKQMGFLKRWALGKIWMAYDNDPAGKKGTADAVEFAKKARLNLQPIRYGKLSDDPGALWDRGGVELLDQEFPHF